MGRASLGGAQCGVSILGMGSAPVWGVWGEHLCDGLSPTLWGLWNEHPSEVLRVGRAPLGWAQPRCGERGASSFPGVGSAWDEHPWDTLSMGRASLRGAQRGASIPGTCSAPMWGAWGQHPRRRGCFATPRAAGRGPGIPKRPRLSPGRTCRAAGGGARTAPAKQDGELCGTGDVPSLCGVPGPPLCPQQGEPPSSEAPLSASPRRSSGAGFPPSPPAHIALLIAELNFLPKSLKLKKLMAQ